MKKLVSVILLLALMTSMCTIFASASSDERIIYNETGEKIIVRTITLDEVPEGIIPLEVDSIAEADALIKNCTATHVAVSGAANNSLLRASGIEDSINWYTLPVSLSGWVALTR